MSLSSRWEAYASMIKKEVYENQEVRRIYYYEYVFFFSCNQTSERRSISKKKYHARVMLVRQNVYLFKFIDPLLIDFCVFI